MKANELLCYPCCTAGIQQQSPSFEFLLRMKRQISGSCCLITILVPETQSCSKISSWQQFSQKNRAKCLLFWTCAVTVSFVMSPVNWLFSFHQWGDWRVIIRRLVTVSGFGTWSLWGERSWQAAGSQRQKLGLCLELTAPPWPFSTAGPRGVKLYQSCSAGLTVDTAYLIQ